MAISINYPVVINGSTTFGRNQQIPSIVEYLIVAGGGGGGGRSTSGTSGAGGNGGGGAGASNAGTANTGGGGGGSLPFSTGAAGGSGVVIIRHSNAYGQATVTGSPTITTSGGYIIYKFTGSGTIRWI